MDNKRKIFTGVLLLFFVATGITYGQWSVELSPATKVENKIGYPLYKWYPDGHITVLPDDKGYIMFWSEFESYRSTGTSPFVEDQTMLDPANSVFGRRGNFNSWDNGGSWLMSVFRKSGNDFIGFYHAEDHWYPHTSNDIAWKSLAVTYSSDKGKTWSNGTQIITSPTTKPATPTWGGAGDCCVVWDHINNRWMCYYQENWILMAISTDPKGAPGTWKKYYNGSFTEQGLGGQHTKLPGLSSVSGGNPSVHWNTYLKKWVMVWHGWSPTSIYLSVSKDGMNWDLPKSIIVSSISGKAWYPTIIGYTDVEAGQIAKIYYADIAGDFSYRNFETRTITFFDSENISPATAQIDQPIDNYKVSSPNEKVEIKASVNNIKAAIERAEFYMDNQLIGKDFSFPYQLMWTPDKSGSHSIKTIFFDVKGEKIESREIKVDVGYNVGITSPHKYNSDFLIYPCPFTDKITLAGLPPGRKEVRIYSATSALLHYKYYSDRQFEINLPDLNVGIYLLMVRGSQTTYQKKITKIEKVRN